MWDLIGTSFAGEGGEGVLEINKSDASNANSSAAGKYFQF